MEIQLRWAQGSDFLAARKLLGLVASWVDDLLYLSDHCASVSQTSHLLAHGPDVHEKPKDRVCRQKTVLPAPVSA